MILLLVQGLQINVKLTYRKTSGLLPSFAVHGDFRRHAHATPVDIHGIQWRHPTDEMQANIHQSSPRGPVVQRMNQPGDRGSVFVVSRGRCKRGARVPQLAGGGVFSVFCLIASSCALVVICYAQTGRLVQQTR